MMKVFLFFVFVPQLFAQEFAFPRAAEDGKIKFFRVRKLVQQYFDALIF